MNATSHLNKFKKAAALVDKQLLQDKKLTLETGTWLTSAVLRLYKKNWVNSPLEKPAAAAAIFFSVWLNDKTLEDGKIFYNIHALKLRQLNGYSITSRKFAAGFRKKFSPLLRHWPNASVTFGPQTLMQGWVLADAGRMDKDIACLANMFLTIDFLVDELLEQHKKQKPPLIKR